MIPVGINEEVAAIAQDIFTALIDHEEGGLTEWWDPKPVLEDSLFSWVDITGPNATRCQLEIERSTAEEIARHLLDIDPEAEVSEDDLLDALGEMANVVGGNLKSLIPEAGELTLPQVTALGPDNSESTPHGEILMNWRQQILIISTWGLPSAFGKGAE